MQVALAQIRLKTADFVFNFNNIIEKIENTDCDLIIFPQADLLDLGGKDLSMDEKCQIEQANFYQQIADKNYDKNILIGNIFISDGNIFEPEDGFFEIEGKTIFISDAYREDVICDLYVLTKNSYFVTNSDFAQNIHSLNDFIYVNAVCMADESIYAGGSFAKNRANEFVLQMPLCTEDVQIIDFSKPIEFYQESMEQQVIDVTTFALKEYCENTGFKKVMLGLSGGLDSALTAALAARALGSENVIGIIMPSMYSTQHSIDDAVELATNLKIKTEKHSITPLFENFMEEIAKERKQDLAEENLQARLRGMILMFFANRDNYLVLSTTNKSEFAMGYGTLYGDMAGGLNIICDLTKTNVYKIANYLNKNGEIIPKNTIIKPPSAELHPGQTDQDSLPEYAILDDIIEMYLEKNCPLEDIYQKYDKFVVDETIKKIYRAQFKRKQACLCVRLTERSFCCGIDLPIMQRYY